MAHEATRHRVAAMFVAVALLAATTTACFPDVAAGEPADASDARMFRAINAQRGAVGVPPLAHSPKLGNLAGSWSWQMMTDGWQRHQDLVAILYRPDFQNFYVLGENLYVAPGSATPEQLVAAWMRLSAHRANILNRGFNVVGIGHFWGPDGRVWVTADFGAL